MNYQATIDYLFSRLPMFHRIGAAAYKADLNNTIALMQHLNHPENKFKSIHVAGTNGKGSTSHLLAAILQCAGYKTGLYTSPHLKDFRERIRINGEMISEQNVIDFTINTKNFIEQVEPSFFEITVGMCFDYFAQQQVDIAIIETGLGGRLDSTNVITPELSIITNISLDHTNLLGDSLEKIAFEKAGIIKKNVLVIVSETSEIAEVFIRKSNECDCVIIFADTSWKVDVINQTSEYLEMDVSNGTEKFHLFNQLNGEYQIKNTKAVIEAIMQLRKQGWKICDEAIEQGFKQVKTLTGLKGRWDVLQKNPMIVADIAHNEAGISQVINQLKNIEFNQLHIVIGMVKDKDITKVLSLLPTDAIYYFTQPDLPRALPVNDLEQMAIENKLSGKSFASVQSAIESAKKNASSNDLILITGSNFVVAEI
jgi:dihydrofolate synthase/folylpolyglutamate synthase